MSEYGLIKSFGIDNGELDGLRPKDCFVLGYELALVDNLIVSGQQIHQPVHADNRDRIEASCRDAGRHFSLKWLEGDASESWLLLDVAPE